MLPQSSSLTQIDSTVELGGGEEKKGGYRVVLCRKKKEKEELFTTIYLSLSLELHEQQKKGERGRWQSSQSAGEKEKGGLTLLFPTSSPAGD